MCSLRAFGHGTPLRALRRSFASPPLSSQCRSPPRREAAVISRAASTAARNAKSPLRNARRQSDSSYRYPPEINIYRQGTLVTSFVGIIRLASLVVVVIGTLFFFPIYTYSYFFPSQTTCEREREVKWYHPPLILLGSCIPALAAFFALAPWVHQIHVRLPALARRSPEDLMRWASNVPRNTILSISVIRFAPWPTVQRARLDDLSRLPFSYTRLTNLEHKPPDHDNYLADNKGSWRSRMTEGAARRVFGRYYVSRSQAKDKSAVPGAWDQMFGQIPLEGERAQRKVVMEQKRAEAKPPTARITPSPKPKS